VIAAVLVEAALDRPGGQFQGALPETGFQRFEIDRVGSPGRYEAGEFGFDGGGELLRAGFFLDGRWRLGPRPCNCASESCSLTSISSAVRRRRRWHSATSDRTIWACWADKERVVGLPAELQTRRK